MPKLTYYQHSVTEAVNHSIESLLSLSISLTGWVSGAFVQQRFPHNHFIKGLNPALFYISSKFMKDSLVEFLTAVGHTPYISSPGYIIDFCDSYKSSNSTKGIGEQETYNQLVEGLNKAVPIYLFTKLLGQNNAFPIDAKQEAFNSFVRATGYYFYEDSHPKQKYINQGHFLQEYELHSSVEAPIWAILLEDSRRFLGAQHAYSFFLLEELTIESVKGIGFYVVANICPGCSEAKEELVGFILETFPEE